LNKVDLNIIAFDVPYPPNYGGVIDVFYKLKALAQLGVKIHLHCFDYGRGEQNILEEYAVKVSYYERKQNPLSLITKKPYVVVSRSSKTLKLGLMSNNAPILFEGLHTCFFIDDEDFKDRFKVVRMHNIEHDYYRGLAQVESNWIKKRYFNSEANKLQVYENVLKYANAIFAISQEDERYLKTSFTTVQQLPVFHGSSQVDILSGRGAYAFYHGNLAVGENNEAALYLVQEVFSNTKHQLIIAGSGASNKLKEACGKHDNIILETSLSSIEIEEYVSQAHVNVLPTFQSTGIKLKLILSLFKGRFCLANSSMVLNTGLEELCYIADTVDEWKQNLDTIFNQEFSDTIIKERQRILGHKFDNIKNATNLWHQFINASQKG